MCVNTRWEETSCEKFSMGRHDRSCSEARKMEVLHARPQQSLRKTEETALQAGIHLQTRGGTMLVEQGLRWGGVVPAEGPQELEEVGM